MTALARAHVGLGSNLDDPRSQVERALAALRALPQTQVVAPQDQQPFAPGGIVGNRPHASITERRE